MGHPPLMRTERTALALAIGVIARRLGASQSTVRTDVRRRHIGLAIAVLGGLLLSSACAGGSSSETATPTRADLPQTACVSPVKVTAYDPPDQLRDRPQEGHIEFSVGLEPGESLTRLSIYGLVDPGFEGGGAFAPGGSFVGFEIAQFVPLPLNHDDTFAVLFPVPSVSDPYSVDGQPTDRAWSDIPSAGALPRDTVVRATIEGAGYTKDVDSFRAAPCVMRPTSGGGRAFGSPASRPAIASAR
jgi:hypothetical protein